MESPTFTDEDLEIVELPQREAMDKQTGLVNVGGNRGHSNTVGIDLFAILKFL
jgi:hypothetical protein